MKSNNAQLIIVIHNLILVLEIFYEDDDEEKYEMEHGTICTFIGSTVIKIKKKYRQIWYGNFIMKDESIETNFACCTYNVHLLRMQSISI